jgi:lipopolysaccharide transport system ATP-binding protein
MTPVIEVSNLGKEYFLTHQTSGRYTALRDVIADRTRSAMAAPLRWFRHDEPQEDPSHEAFWALREVSFTIQPGESVGIIGRNGAGKSTLLKLLSRITEPTTGRITLRGRVASLLEVGTGFHPELTGRENVYLNGVILGMSRAEVRRKFDEIVAFAEVEKFLDTPVKHYSSGMYVRLAFAVAAHLESEILVVDEVLAVGDLAFQKKCLNKVQDVTGMGRTVLFVSHNMQLIRNLCTRAVLLNGGRVESDGDTESALTRYHELLGKLKVSAETAIQDDRHRRGSGSVRFTNIEALDVTGNPTFSFSMGDTVRFQFSYCVLADVPDLLVSIILRGGMNAEIVTSVRHVVSSVPLAKGATGQILVEFPNLSVRPGQYPLYFWLGNSASQPFDVVDDVTLPLSISISSLTLDPDLVPMNPVGFFSIPSTLSVKKTKMLS